MNLNALSDDELIDYVLKHDSDPIRVRIASIMERMPGCILDDLEEAGMDPASCDFENTYSPGQYIRHLESELDVYHRENLELRQDLEAQRARTIADLITELNAEIHKKDYLLKEARAGQAQAEKERDHAKHQLGMWTVLEKE